jgi:hypothetical protein
MPRSTGECESGEFIVDLVSLGKAFPNNTVSPLRYLTLTPSLPPAPDSDPITSLTFSNTDRRFHRRFW